ncbi:MAG: UPF0280 family protein [Alphaproteobacteria bacterium]|nr:UPF0280 family protein [Alphaproteobacteria bacterium]
MSAGPVRALLADGRRHFQHGPIDLILEAFGAPTETDRAYTRAWRRFEVLLDELVEELPLLRRPVSDHRAEPEGPTARRMWRACRPHRGTFVTPMAAVAGAVADEVLASMVSGGALDRAYVNDGGDIALYLTPGHGFDSGIVTDPTRPAIDGVARIDFHDPVRGIATSGRGGRSFSLGIADSVTVLGSDAAAADVAATLIGNSVDVDHPAIARRAGVDLDPDSDLGERLVTIEVGTLDDEAVRTALNRGVAVAVDLFRKRLICGALLTLRGESRMVGDSAAADATTGQARLKHG